MARRWLMTLIAFALVPLTGGSSQAQAPKAGAAEGEHYAFLVACADYDKKELQPLNFARDDVTALHQALLDAGMLQENIVVMHDKRTERRYLPETRKIREELKLLIGEMRPEDTLFVAFAGHGVQFKGEKQSYFCPVDARIADRSTLISLDEIYKDLERCKARRKMVLIDACRNDPLSALSRGSVAIESVSRPQTVNAPQGVVVLHSCSAGESSFEDPALKHGVFFHHVLQGYGGRADLDKNKQVSIDELAIYVTRETQKYARLNLAASQIPQRKGEFSGEWTLRNIGTPIEHPHIEHCVPDGSEFVFAINVEQILNSPHAKEYLGALRKAPHLAGKYEELLKATGLNPLEDIVNIVVASPPAIKGEFNRMAVTFHGRFEQGKITSRWQRAGHRLHRVNDGAGGQFRIYESNGAQRAFMAVANRTTIVVAMQQDLLLEILLKEEDRREPNIKNKHLELLLENRYDPKASVWMVMMGTAYSANGRTLRDQGVRYFVGAFHLTEDVEIKVVFSADKAEVVKSLSVPAQWRRFITSMVDNRQDIAASIIRGCTLFPEENYLHLRGKVEADVFMRWFEGQ